MARVVVLAHADDDDLRFFELLPCVAEGACLLGAARCVVLRIEVHDVPLSLEILVRDDLSLFVGQRKGRGFVAGLELHELKVSDYRT